MVKGNITKSAGFYTVSIFVEGKREYKESGIYSLQDAQEILEYQKKVITNNLEVRRSYPELEGIVIDAVVPKEGVRKARVVGCDYWIGITLCFDVNPSRYILCLRGPGSTLGKKVMSKNPGTYDNYDDLFTMIVDKIKDGYIKVQDIADIEMKSNNPPGDHPSSKNCAFNS